MKLVAAKCPNCGANIDVDKDSDSTKCEFCKSKIIVDDAIAKYKVEISGNVEIKNLPKLENHLKLGDRYFEDKEYKDAYKQYEKACELDPDNSKAVLRKGLSKSYSTGYATFDLKSAVDGMKNAYKILKKEKADSKTINSYIIECYSLVYIKQDQVIDFYHRNNVDKNGIALIITRLRMCIGQLQYLKGLVEDNNALKINILNSTIKGLEFMSGSLYYTNNSNGTPNRALYKLPDKETIKCTLDATIEERNALDPKAKVQYEKEQEKKEQEKKTMNIFWGVLAGIILLIMLMAGISGSNSQTEKEPFEKEWVSDEMTIDFKPNSKVLVALSDGTSAQYTYQKVCDKETSTCNISIFDSDDIKYRLYFKDATADNGNVQTLCLKEKEECTVFFD